MLIKIKVVPGASREGVEWLGTCTEAGSPRSFG
jgi:hypothetical protein